MLQVAALDTCGDTGQPDTVPLPRWRLGHPPARATTGRLLNQLRHERWASTLRPESLTGFTSPTAPDTKRERLLPQLPGTLLCATN